MDELIESRERRHSVKLLIKCYFTREITQASEIIIDARFTITQKLVANHLGEQQCVINLRLNSLPYLFFFLRCVPSPPLFFIVHANLSLLDKHSAYGRPRSTDSRERYGWRARGRGRRNRGGKQKTARAPQIGTRSAIPRNLSDQSRSGESSAGRHTRSTSDHELENGTTTHLISRIDTGAGFNRDPLRKNRKSLLFSPEKTNLLL